MFKRTRYAPGLIMRIRVPILLLALPLSAPAGVAAQDRRSLDRTEWAQLTIHERVMIRIPRRARLAPPPRGRRMAPPPLDLPVVWSERKAPRCVPMDRLTGEAAVRGGDVDLLLVNGRRLRAKLSRDCPALDFYSGFYLKPNSDGMICGGRDVLRARSGGACPIAGFRRLEAQR